MNIKIKNNPEGKSKNPEVKKVAEYFLNEVCGSEVNKVKNVHINFKRMPRGCGGRAIMKNGMTKDLYIELSKNASTSETYRVLAHECTHIKQYALKEITYSHRLKRTRRGIIRQTVTNWKGREILRSKYRTRAWEVEARANEKLAVNVLNKIGTKATQPTAPVKVTTITKPIAKPVNAPTPIMSKALALLKLGTLSNADFTDKMMEGVADKQDRLQIRKGLFNLKEIGAIEHYYVEGVTMVRLQLFFNMA